MRAQWSIPESAGLEKLLQRHCREEGQSVRPLAVGKLLLGIWDGRGEQLLRVPQRGRERRKRKVEDLQEPVGSLRTTSEPPKGG